MDLNITLTYLDSFTNSKCLSPTTKVGNTLGMGPKIIPFAFRGANYKTICCTSLSACSPAFLEGQTLHTT